MGAPFQAPLLPLPPPVSPRLSPSAPRRVLLSLRKARILFLQFLDALVNAVCETLQSFYHGAETFAIFLMWRSMMPFFRASSACVRRFLFRARFSPANLFALFRRARVSHFRTVFTRVSLMSRFTSRNGASGRVPVSAWCNATGESISESASIPMVV